MDNKSIILYGHIVHKCGILDMKVGNSGMSQRSRIITLSVLSILIVACIVLGVTYSFMQANIDSTSVTEVSLSSCANIMLNDTDVSIDLENTYPMSRNRALQTTPYTFTVSSSCNESVGFYIYIATLNTNTLDANNIHYIITNHNSKEALVEGILGEAKDGLSDFEEYQINELNNGIKGTYGNIYRLYSNGLHNNSELTYDLYLYIDESVTNETMGLTFNAGIAVKTFDYNFPIVNSAYTNEEKLGVVTLNINATPGDNEIVKYYFSKDGGETYVTSDNNSFTFTGLDAGKKYNFRVYVEDALGYTSAVYSLDETTSTLADLCTGLSLSNCVTEVMYTGIDGENGLYYHDGQGTYTNVSEEAGDNSYRFSGANPNNYVCLMNLISGLASGCENYMFRIIGAFEDNGDYQLKLIQDTAYAGGMWNSNGDNSWITSFPNSDLNSSFIEYLGEYGFDTNLVVFHDWWIDGDTTGNGYNGTPLEIYNIDSSSKETYNAKVALMYVSDYGYAALPEYWKISIRDYENTYGNNWLIPSEWDSNVLGMYSTQTVMYVSSTGSLGGEFPTSDGWYYPTFYLNSSANYVTGVGTRNDPFFLFIN